LSIEVFLPALFSRLTDKAIPLGATLSSMTC
jgi:hypothetical protein